MKFKLSICKILVLATGFIFPTAVRAMETGLIDPQKISEVWINPGLYSFHFQRDKGLNANNYGLGFDYRYSTTSSITLGEFKNSDRQASRYLGWYWEPVSIGAARLGAVLGAIDGYPKMRDGGWFAAVIPSISFEHDKFGANILVIPSYQNRLYGAISIQLKYKIH